MKRILAWPHFWEMTACLVAVAAFGVSILSWADAHTAADVKMLIAKQVHLTVGNPNANIYLEPVFVSTVANNRAEVVDDVTATLWAPGVPSQDLVWFQTGMFDISSSPDLVVNWHVTSLHPVPIVIDPGVPQNPILRFRTVSPFAWISGTYRVVVRAHRVVSPNWLEQTTFFDLSDPAVAEINRRGDAWFTDVVARPTD